MPQRTPGRRRLTKARRLRAVNIARETVRGLYKHVHDRGVGILRVKDDSPAEIGSGTCVQIGPHFLIATAAHVVSDAAREELCLVFDGGPFTHAQRIKLHAMNSRGGGKQDAIDVAWILVDATDAQRMAKTFIPLQRTQPFMPSPKHGGQFMLWGAPTELIDKEAIRARGRVNIRFVTHTTGLLAKRLWPQHGNADYDLFLRFPRDPAVNERVDGTRARPPEPPGMSGGGIWSIDYGSPIWLPDNSRLVGIEQSWNEAAQWIRGTRIEHWLGLVAEDFPELRTEVQHHLDEHLFAEGTTLSRRNW